MRAVFASIRNVFHADRLTRNVFDDKFTINTTPIHGLCSIVDVKTIGERIRQAREQLGWSGEHLARKAGYAHQSAIGNLEARASGQGGRRLHVIADALGVSEAWLRRGPDCDRVPFLNLQPVAAKEPDPVPYVAQASSKRQDPWIAEAVQLLASLPDDDRRAAVLCLRAFVAHLGPPRDGQALSMAA